MVVGSKERVTHKTAKSLVFSLYVYFGEHGLCTVNFF